MKQLILFLILLFFYRSGFTSEPDYNFKRITPKDGLSNSWVRSFFQDDFGFIWIGTSDGLNRYDGYAFKTFRPINIDNFEHGNFTVNKIIEKDSLNLWVCSDDGLFTFNLKTEILSIDTLLSPHPVLSVVKDKDENYWFGTNHGLIKYNVQQKRRIIYNSVKNDSTHISSNYINSLFLDNQNNLWIGTKNGLYLLHEKTNNFIRFFNNKKNKSVGDVLTICEDNKQRIWVGTANNGLLLINNNQNNYEVSKIKEGNIASLSIDKKQQIWIGYSNGKGLEILDLNSFDKGKLSSVVLENNPSNASTISDNSIFCFFNDDLGDLWIGTYSNGISFYSERSKPFHNVSVKTYNNNSISNNLVNSFFEEEEFLWVGTEGGLDRFDKKNKIVEHYKYNPDDPNSLGANPVLSIQKDSKGNLWVGTWAGGLNKYNYQKNNFKRYLPEADNPSSISSANIFSIVEDSDNNLWIGTNSGGLNLFNYKDESFSSYKHNPLYVNSLGGRSVNSIIETSSGELYISLYSILEHFNKEHNNFEHISLYGDSKKYTSGNITYLFQDSKDNIWVATNIGLELYNPIDNSFKRYTINDGLADNTIHALLEDEHQNLWLSTNKGLTKFLNGVNIPSDPSFLNFSIDDGSTSYNFKERSAFKNKNGIMYFGSTNGYTYFHPDSISLNTIIPKIVFTNILVQESHPNESTNFEPLKINLNLSSKIDLYYPNTDFIIGFAALNYLNSEKNNFKYKLVGYDTEWVISNHAQLASYTNIQEGKYTFKVMGANNDGFWCEKATKIIIEVHPPWWKSIFFKIIFFLFIFLIGILIIYLRFKVLKNENKVLEARVEKRTNELTKLNELLEDKQQFISKQNSELELHHNQLEKLVDNRTKELIIARKKAEESDKLKSSFLANMSHEIRTPLNAIMGFSAILCKLDLPQIKREKYIKHIENNGKALSLLVNDILDISIIEANQMVLSISTISVNGLLNELYIIFDQQNNNKLEFIYINADNKYDLYITTDAYRLRQIIINLLSNAFKYTDTGTIKYGYTIAGDNIQFFISDTGIGIKNTDIDKIFDLFYKSDKVKSKLYRGTGIGLAICKKLINQLEGKIWVESKIKEGTTFYFTLPIKKKRY